MLALYKPDISVESSLGEFHVAYWADSSSFPMHYNVRYRHTPYTDPTAWSPKQTVNNTAVWPFPPTYQPTVAVDWASSEAGVAWALPVGAYAGAILFDRTDWSVVPIPDIKANGSDGPVELTHGETLSVTVELDPGDRLGDNADWWVLADTSMAGWYYYHLSGAWYPGAAVTAQGPLGALSTYEVLNYSDLSPGTYVFYFGVDYEHERNNRFE